MKPSTALFITMNPGYAGRSELPDNLKVLFRPVSMMVADYDKICDIILKAQGFDKSAQLAKKVAGLYDLMLKQLSKQDHYDFKLRALISVLVFAGNLRRQAKKDMQNQKKISKNQDMDDQQMQEKETDEQILMRAIKNMSIPKFVKEDVQLFDNLFTDLFPNVDLIENENNVLKKEIEYQLEF